MTAGLIFGIVGAVIVGKAGYVQVLRSAAIMGEGTLVVQADGARRYQYNPRLQEIMREIPKGSIYDRGSLPLATSRWEELEAHRRDYARLGVDIDRACSHTESRHYPFGGLTFDLLGDLAHGHGFIAVVDEEVARGLQDQLADILSFPFPSFIGTHWKPS